VMSQLRRRFSPLRRNSDGPSRPTVFGGSPPWRLLSCDDVDVRLCSIKPARTAIKAHVFVVAFLREPTAQRLTSRKATRTAFTSDTME
jgi:hypothetical protein